MSSLRNSAERVVLSRFPRTEPRPAPTTFRETSLGSALHRVFLASASLRLAIPLLAVFTLCLIAATFIESACNARIANDLIYGTWWFTLLLCLLAVNILCAALKKFPWKRHQTGFLITHLGLIVLVFGGLLTNLGGVEGQMMLIDTDDRGIQTSLRMPNRSDTIQLVNRHQIEIIRVPRKERRVDDEMGERITGIINAGIEVTDSLRDDLKGHHWSLNLSPGSFAWKADEEIDPQLPPFLRVLSAIADPFPGYSAKLDEDTRLTVENYYPHTERWPYAPAPEVPGKTFPALQLQLTTPMTPVPMKRWVTSLPAFGHDATPVAFEMFVLLDPALLPEFLNPPAQRDLGEKGQLVVAVGPERIQSRIALDRVAEGETITLPETGLRLTLIERGDLTELLPNRPQGEAPEGAPSYPAVRFELSNWLSSGTYVACARLTHRAVLVGGTDVGGVAAWYHYPDFRWGEKHRRGALQFLHAPDGKVYYRVYDKEGLVRAGRELDVNDRTQVHELPWKPMEMRFEVVSWLPSAEQREHIIPRDVPPGSEPAERFEPALRCSLECKGKKKEFRVRMSSGAAQATVGGEVFFIRYRNATRRLDWDLTLKHARQLNDPGTNRAAAYESDVLLSPGEGAGKAPRDYTVSMNHTLDHGGFKVYQTNYRPMTHPDSGAMLLSPDGRLVSMSGFTVADDPGLFCKYLGSLLLVLGIGVMFYMRAYFFKPRRPAPASPA